MCAGRFHSVFAIRRSLFLFPSLLAAVPGFAEPTFTAEQGAVTLAETPNINNVVLSPDGTLVTYAVTRRSVKWNTRETEHYLQQIPQSGEKITSAKSLNLPEGTVAIQWRPDSKCLSMVLGGTAYDRELETANENTQFACYDIATGETKIFQVNGHAVTANYQWSPHGNYVAYLAPLAERAPLDPTRGVPRGLVEPGRYLALFVLNVASGAVEQLTPGFINVARLPRANFSWSPDESALAFTRDREMFSRGISTELIIVNRRSRQTRPLVTRPGKDGRPCWSPNGRLIGFLTDQGSPAYRSGGWFAVVPSSGGEIVDFPAASPLARLSSACRWSLDGRSFLYVSPLGMAQRLVRVDVAERRAEVLPPASTLPLAFEDNHSFSADSRVLAFTQESVTKPPDLYVVPLDKNGKPTDRPRRLTNLAPNFMLGKEARVKEVSWLSRDEKFTIHGLLLTPGSAEQTRLPTVLGLWGGPGMVRRGFAGNGGGLYLLLAARGYAVLIPNTRGRAGYGVAFHNAIRVGKSNARLPLDDAMSGLDRLIERGITNPERMGVHGFSYGGFLTAYAITQTDRFEGAVILEGFFSSLETPLDCIAWRRFLCRDLVGIHDPYDKHVRERMIQESPAFHANRVRTPTLILSRSDNLESVKFYHELRRFETPASVFVYDEDHGFEAPAAIADSLTRSAEWLDYWVRGIPFPDLSRAKEYGVDEWAKL